MYTSLPTLTPQDQPPDANPAEAAFAELSAKVDFLETLLRGLVAKREEMPDYSETLGEIADLLEKMRNAINTLARRPAMTFTPDAMAGQIAAAAAKARAEDSTAIRQARERMDSAARDMERLAGTVATIDEQRRYRHLWGGSGLLLGIVVWSFLPGFIARTAPASWHLPERIAARTVGEPTLWESGSRIMKADSPAAWQAIADAADMRRDNREVIDACEQEAVEAKQPVRCTIRIRARTQDGN